MGNASGKSEQVRLGRYLVRRLHEDPTINLTIREAGKAAGMKPNAVKKILGTYYMGLFRTNKLNRFCLDLPNHPFEELRELVEIIDPVSRGKPERK